MTWLWLLAGWLLLSLPVGVFVGKAIHRNTADWERR
jgi:hypothetical protein